MIPIYKDPTKSIEERVQDLLPRMTLDEKIREMHLFTRPTTRFPDHKPGTKFTAEEVEPMLEHGCSMYTTDSAPAELINGLQDYMLHETRLGIPFTVHGEALHGAMNENATVFPNPIAMAATFDEGLILETATAVGEEERANGVRQVYAPNLDLSQEPRWGRCEENFGEDPYLTSRMGVSYVKGLQANGVAASPKHYAAHGNPQGGLNMATIHCGERELRETYLYPFKKAFTEGGAWSVMPAYHEMDGVPCHSNYHLLTEILRDEFGLKGPVISDWNGITRIHALHRVAETPEEAGEMALRAGVDVEAPGIFGYGEGFRELVKAGKIPMELVDQAVGRVLWLKFKLGLFEDPYALPEEEKKKHCRTEAHLALSRHVEEEGAVLLKNEGNLLPLSDKIGKVALIGPNSDILQLGDYTVRPATDRAVTLLQALTERLGEDRVLHARGSNIAFGKPEWTKAAVQAAKEADVAIVALGDNSSYYGNEFWSDREDPEVRRATVTCGETFDVDDLNLPEAQRALLKAVYETGTPVVLLLQSGRPHTITWEAEHIPAILETWYAGEMGGYAIANLLFGDAVPSGRLPWTLPRSIGQIPVYYNHHPSCGLQKDTLFAYPPGTPEEPGKRYVFNTPLPLFPFGYGLSYTTFEYSDLKLSAPVIREGETETVCVTVKNTGSVAARHSVLLFLQDLYCKVSQPVCRLRGFKKVFLRPGEETVVSFTLGREDFEYIDLDYKPAVDPGDFTVTVGELQATFRLK